MEAEGPLQCRIELVQSDTCTAEQQELGEECGERSLSPVWLFWNNLAPLTSLSVSLRPSIYKGSGGFCGRGSAGSDLMGLEWQGCCYLSGGVDGGR